MEEIKDLKQVVEILKDIDEDEVIFKDSLSYNSNIWKDFDKLSVKTPIQRKLTKRECVLDFDHVSESIMNKILDFLEDHDFRYIAWRSSDDGYHVHFWTKFKTLNVKRQIVAVLRDIVKRKFGVLIDKNPIGHGCIRAEFSIHPEKHIQKKPFRANFTRLFPTNDVVDMFGEKVLGLEHSDSQRNSLNKSVDGKTPSCVKYMLSHRFTDGRERIIFSLISWFKASGMEPKQIYYKIRDWCDDQDYYMSSGQIFAKIGSSNGSVGCSYRHDVLEEIGVDMSHCKLEK